MAEINTLQAANRAAGIKGPAGDHNGVRVAVVTMPAAWTAANGDTAATGIILPAGARPMFPRVSCAAGAASSTMSVGLRNAKTGAVLSATALVDAQAITSATNALAVSGTAIRNGANYTVPVDAEIYLTFGGANPTANQAIRVEVPYVAP